MPVAQSSSTINARRFAALLAGFDTGNGSEEEAVAKARALRRMAESAGLRIVDAMELPDVKQAIDTQMHPNRQESPALQEALELTAALQAELTERTRDVSNLAERLRRQEEQMEAMGLRAATFRRRVTAGNIWSGIAPGSAAPRRVIPMWSVQLGAAVAALAMLISSVVGHFHEGGQANGLGNGQRASAPLVHKNRAVRPARKRRAVPHGLRRGGADIVAR